VNWIRRQFYKIVAWEYRRRLRQIYKNSFSVEVKSGVKPDIELRWGDPDFKWPEKK